jgi:hypothetical protein
MYNSIEEEFNEEMRSLSQKELVSFIRELFEKSETIKKNFKYDEHVAELIRRGTYGVIINRHRLIKALNTVDISDDEVLYTIEPSMLFKELGL